MRAVARPGRRGSGRWVWGLSGLVTAAVLGVPLAHLITGVGDPQSAYARPQHVVTRTETMPQPVTSLVVDSYGGQVQVASGPVSRVQVTETIMYDQQNTAARRHAVGFRWPPGPVQPCVRKHGLHRRLQRDRAAGRHR